MPRFARACLGCKQLTSNGSYCTNCSKAFERVRDANPTRRQKKATLYGGTYRKQAKQVRQTATTCHLCGEGARLNDPWEADHLTPGDPHSALAAAHRSCNQKRGNKPLSE